jgi:acetate kinase
MEMEQLIVNIGSSSKKYSVYSSGVLVFSCYFEHESGGCTLSIVRGNEHTYEHLSADIFERAVVYFLELYTRFFGEKIITSIGIRVVAPGEYFQQHRSIDEVFLKRLQHTTSLAPIHIAATLREILLLKDVFPTTKLVGVSDSAFHKEMPHVAQSYGLPASLAHEGIKRFGYHGLSIASVVKTLDDHLKGVVPEKMLVLHLGSGCSITALHDGKTVDTSMGFTPLEGLLMSTRSGSFDPAVILTLLSHGKTKNDIERLINKDSGLLGVSSISSDMRELLTQSYNGNSEASHAIDLFVYQIVKYIGAYTAVLGGVDAIVFTGTIGERSFVIREKIIEHFRYLPWYIHQDNNNQVHDSSSVSEIGAPGSLCQIFVVPTNEAQSILEAMKEVG